MTLFTQTQTDVQAMLETTDQLIHEMRCSPEAINTYCPSEVAAMYDLRDYLRGMLPD